MKRYLIILLWIIILAPAWASTLAEIWKSNEIAACKYLEKGTLLDLDSKEEAELISGNGFLDLCFDKSSQKIFVLKTESIPGKRYEDPDTQVIKILEFAPPAFKATQISSFNINKPSQYHRYTFPSMYLNKEGNLSIIINFDYNDYTTRGTISGIGY